MKKDEKIHENRWLGRGQRPPNSVPWERNQHGGPHTLPSQLPSQCMRSEGRQKRCAQADVMKVREMWHGGGAQGRDWSRGNRSIARVG